MADPYERAEYLICRYYISAVFARFLGDDGTYIPMNYNSPNGIIRFTDSERRLGHDKYGEADVPISCGEALVKITYPGNITKYFVTEGEVARVLFPGGEFFADE